MKFNIVLFYFITINVISAALFMIDKRRAVKGQWRVSEKTLLLTAFFGGAPLAFITAKAIRHKTQHLKFMITLPLLSVLQITLLIWLKYYMGG